MAEHLFTKEETERVMNIVVGDKAGLYPMEDEIQLSAIISDVLTNQTVNEATDTLKKTKEIVRRLGVAIQEKKLANKVKEEVDKIVAAINTLYQEDARHYCVDAERKAGARTAEIKIYKHSILVNQFRVFLEVL